MPRLLNPEAKLLSISSSIDSNLLAIARHLAPPIGQSSEYSHELLPSAPWRSRAASLWAAGLVTWVALGQVRVSQKADHVNILQ